jgi:CheY-like chemotaxis protein
MQNTKLVLIIDDEPVIAWLLASAFRDRGHGVEIATNGMDGLAQARRHPPDAVVLDVMMPEMDGFSVLEALRSDPNTAAIPVLLMSAAFEPSFRQRADQNGGVFIEKPFDWAKLVRTVESMLFSGDPAAA